jgi:photosystem II stability/assembly factor-like uncharacterized protein
MAMERVTASTLDYVDDEAPPVVPLSAAEPGGLRRHIARASCVITALLLVAGIAAATVQRSPERPVELGAKAAPTTVTPSTTAVTVTTPAATPTTSTSLLILPTSSLPPLPVTLPRPAVRVPHPTVPTLQTPTTRVQRSDACGRADANGERAVHIGAVAPTGRVIVILTEGDVALSDDLGATWTFHCNAVRTDDGHAPYVGRMSALGSDVVWAEVVASGSQRPFVRSLDGGQTWTNINAPKPGMRVYGASFVSATIVFAWGPTEINRRALFRTVDGVEWTEVATANNEPLGDAVFVDGNVGWMTTTGSQNDTVYATRDGGATWQKSVTPGVTQILDIDAYDADHVHLTAGLQDGRRAVVSTSDSGATWHVTEVPTTPVTVAAIDDRAAILVAQSAPIWHTLDGGTTWTRVTNREVDPYSPRFADAAGGRYAVVPSGSMLAVTDDGSRSWRRLTIRAR